MKKSSHNNSIISVDNLSVDFHLPKHIEHAVQEVSFDIKAGETLALVGGSGSGKSVTALSILRLLPYPMAKHPRGHIWFNNEDVMAMTPSKLRQLRGNNIAMIFQEPMTALNPLQTIDRQIAESIFLHDPRTTRAQAKKRVLELLDWVRLPRAKERIKAYPHELSGGQRQRIVIAMALANNPQVLIADEPTTALDVTVQQQILETLMQLQSQLHMAILFITHDLTVVRKIADRVCVMYRGEIVEHGDVYDVLNRPQHDYTKTLLKSDITGYKKPYKDDAPTLLQADNVHVEFVLKKSFFGKTLTTLKAVNTISLSLKQGQTIGIVGESGSGKSTLGKAILQLLDTESVRLQRLEFAGKSILNLPKLSMRQLRKHMQVVFQDPFGSLSPRMNIGAILGEGLDVHFPQFTKQEKLHKIQQALVDVELSPEMINRYAHEFSGGQRQRIAIARAIILRPKFLLLDEPTSALDRNVQVQVVSLLRHLQQKYQLSYLFISHDLAVVRALSDHVIIMQNGIIVEQGSVNQIFENPQKTYTKNLLHAAFDTARIGLKNGAIEPQ